MTLTVDETQAARRMAFVHHDGAVRYPHLDRFPGTHECLREILEPSQV